jgi:hypothetical protein
VVSLGSEDQANESETSITTSSTLHAPADTEVSSTTHCECGEEEEGHDDIGGAVRLAGDAAVEHHSYPSSEPLQRDDNE